VELNFRELSPDKTGCPIILLHGLFGSAANLQSIAKALADDYPVILPDLRNHGRSPHDADVSYQSMADDLLSLMDAHACEQVNILGHSMGGKVAMWLALNHPDRVNHLIIADIAPVQYPNRFKNIIQAMLSLDLSTLLSRQDADNKLAEMLESQSLRSYLLQNLVSLDGQWQWRMNLQALSDEINQLMDFPATSAEFDKPALFIGGGRSDYLADEYANDVLNYFPMAEFVTVAEAGHWLYAEQPQQFIQEVKSSYR